MNHPLFSPNLFSRLTHSKCWLTTHLWMPKQLTQMSLFCISLSDLFCSPIRDCKSYLDNFLLLKFSGLTSVLLSNQNIFCILPRPGWRPLIRPHERSRFASSLASSRVELWIQSLANARISRQFRRLISFLHSWGIIALEILLNALQKCHSKPVFLFLIKKFLTFNFKIVPTFKNIVKLVQMLVCPSSNFAKCW